MSVGRSQARKNMPSSRRKTLFFRQRFRTTHCQTAEHLYQYYILDTNRQSIYNIYCHIFFTFSVIQDRKRDVQNAFFTQAEHMFACSGQRTGVAADLAPVCLMPRKCFRYRKQRLRFFMYPVVNSKNAFINPRINTFLSKPLSFDSPLLCTMHFPKRVYVFLMPSSAPDFLPSLSLISATVLSASAHRKKHRLHALLNSFFILLTRAASA